MKTKEQIDNLVKAVRDQLTPVRRPEGQERESEKPLAEWFRGELDECGAAYCPICQTEKVKRVEYHVPSRYMRATKTKIVPLGYELDAGEAVLSVFCPKCLVLFEVIECEEE